MATRGLCGNGCLAAFPLTVIPRSFGINAQGQPVYDGSATYLDLYATEAAEAAATDALAPVNPDTILPHAPLPNQRGSGPAAPVVPPAGGEEEEEDIVPVEAPSAKAAEQKKAEEEAEARRKQRNRVVGGAVGGAFASVFLSVCAFVAVKALQQRRAEMTEVPERPHLDVL
jgi:hypothetical protein